MVDVRNILQSEEEAYLKIKKIRFGYFNDKVSSPRSIYTFDLFEQVRFVANVHQTSAHCRCQSSKSCWTNSSCRSSSAMRAVW